MREATGQSDRINPTETFRRRRNELQELLDLSQRAAQIYQTRAASSFTCLSELLDETLPIEPEREERLARSIALDVDQLRRLRQGQLDPLQSPADALAEIVNALRLNRASTRRLISADRSRFESVAARSNSATPGVDPFAELEATIERIGLDFPDR